jgi:DNA-binding response OmpR family regulator
MNSRDRLRRSDFRTKVERELEKVLNSHPRLRKLREKIEEDPSNPKYIETVWGIGYIFIK